MNRSVDMEPSLESDTTFNIIIEDEDNETGAVPKYTIWGAAPTDDGTVWANKVLGGGSHLIKCDMVQICHGTTIDGGSPASLLVFLFVFQPFGQNKRFKSAEVTIVFHGEGDSKDPDVDDIAPKTEFRAYQSKETIELSHELNAAVDVGFQVVKATPGYKWTKKSTTEKEHYASIIGQVMRKNEIMWAMYENADTESGIPTLMQTAVLVKRGKSRTNPLGQKFSMEMKIAGKVNRLSELKSMHGRQKKGEEQIFDLENDRKGDIKDVTNLKLVNLEKYQRLLTKRDWPEDESKSQEKASDASPDKTHSDGKETRFQPLHNDAQDSHMPATQNLPTSNITGSSPIIGGSLQSGIPKHDLGIQSTKPTWSKERKLPGGELNADEGPNSFNGVGPEKLPSVSQISNFPAKSNLALQKSDPSWKEARISSLHSQLAVVREEANLTKRLMNLMEKERCIVEEIAQLEFQ